MVESTEDALRHKLNAETAKLSWKELQRHFARGVVIVVAPELDLVDVAVSMARDDKAAVETWMSAGQVARAGDDDARAWSDRDATLWTVVVAPWVLVQDVQTP